MNRIDIEDLRNFIIYVKPNKDNNIDYIDVYDNFEYKKEDGFIGHKKKEYIDNEYDFIRKMAEDVLEYMESEDKGKIMKKQ